MRKIILSSVFLILGRLLWAQELKATVTVISNQIGNNVNKNTFRTLQTSLYNFINNRKWTTDNYSPNEKIECSFILNLQPSEEANIYNASLTIQAARPIFNTSYLSPIINYQDKNIIFKYVEFQQLDFNENRISGADPLVSNLTAIIAYYVNMILAFDYDSFSLRSGDVYFQKAQNIVNNAPEGRNISGWKSFEGLYNRYWLAENMINSRYTIMHEVYYNYYRKSMDKLYENESVARIEMLNVLNLLINFNTDNPNKMINQFFFSGKSSELIKLFLKAPEQIKLRASEILQKIDITNASKYKDELK